MKPMNKMHDEVDVVIQQQKANKLCKSRVLQQQWLLAVLCPDEGKTDTELTFYQGSQRDVQDQMEQHQNFGKLDQNGLREKDRGHPMEGKKWGTLNTILDPQLQKQQVRAIMGQKECQLQPLLFGHNGEKEKSQHERWGTETDRKLWHAPVRVL